jgi:hypothetical protein
MIQAEIPEMSLKVPIKLPKDPIPADLIHSLGLQLPNLPNFQVNMISLADLSAFLRMKLDIPEFNHLFEMIESLPAPVLPAVEIPKNLTLPNLLKSMEINITSIPGVPQLRSFNIEKLICLPNLPDVDLTDLVTPDIPAIPIQFEAIKFTPIDVILMEAFPNFSFAVPKVKIPWTTLSLKFLGMLLIILETLKQHCSWQS